MMLNRLVKLRSAFVATEAQNKKKREKENQKTCERKKTARLMKATVSKEFRPSLKEEVGLARSLRDAQKSDLRLK